MTDQTTGSTLISRLERLNGYARRAEWWDVAEVIGARLKDLRTTERERPWPLGRCTWCWAVHNRLREATITDSGGGPPSCVSCCDEIDQNGAIAA